MSCCAVLCLYFAGPGTSVDTSTVQRVSAPTRDIYVERTQDGDRVFAGFGRPSQEYCDCFLDPAKLPEDIIKVSIEQCPLPTLGWKQCAFAVIHHHDFGIAPGICLDLQCRTLTLP